MGRVSGSSQRQRQGPTSKCSASTLSDTHSVLPGDTMVLMAWTGCESSRASSSSTRPLPPTAITGAAIPLFAWMGRGRETPWLVCCTGMLWRCRDNRTRCLRELLQVAVGLGCPAVPRALGGRVLNNPGCSAQREAFWRPRRAAGPGHSFLAQAADQLLAIALHTRVTTCHSSTCQHHRSSQPGRPQPLTSHLHLLRHDTREPC